MRLKLSNLAAIFILALVILGCRSCETVESDKVAQSEIYQEYTVHGTKDKTDISAAYRVGGSTGTTVDLDAPSRVGYNGKEMSENSRAAFTGTYYSATAAAFTGDHNFTYTNGDGTIFKNSFKGQAFELIDPPKTADIRTEIVIKVSRGPGDGEAIDTSIVSKAENQGMNNSNQVNAEAAALSYYLNVQGNYDAARKAIVLPAGTLKNFAPGPAEITVKINGFKAIEQKTHGGGAITWSYTAPAAGLTIAK